VADGYSIIAVIVFDAQTGKYKRHWGAYGKRPDDGLKFPPRAQLIQGPPPEGFGNPVHAVLVSNDDLVYVGDRTNNRLQVFRKDGTFVKETFIARNTLQAEGTSTRLRPHPTRSNAFSTSSMDRTKVVRVLDRQSLQMMGTIGGHAGHNAREFFHIHGIRRRLEGQSLPGRGEQRSALLQIRVQKASGELHSGCRASTRGQEDPHGRSIVLVLLGAAARPTPARVSRPQARQGHHHLGDDGRGRAAPSPRWWSSPRWRSRRLPPSPPARPPAMIPAHCRVQIVLKPSGRLAVINMEMWLPPAGQWNGKFMGVGTRRVRRIDSGLTNEMPQALRLATATAVPTPDTRTKAARGPSDTRRR
jgi:hypothetical protein